MNILDLEMLKGNIVWDETGYYRYNLAANDDPVSDEDLKHMGRVNFTLLPEAMNEKFLKDSSDYRRPYYVWRGNKVSKDTAYRFITATNEFHDACTDPMDTPGLLSCFGRTHHFPNNYGVCQPNGNQAHNGILWKYVHYEDIIVSTAWLAEAFPEMTYIFSILNYDESPDLSMEYRDWMYKIKKEDINISLYVHDGQAEMVGAKRAVELVHEFDKLYTRAELELCDAQESERYHAEHPKDVTEYLDWLEKRS